MVSRKRKQDPAPAPKREITTAQKYGLAEPELMCDRVRPHWGPLATRLLQSPHAYDGWKQHRSTEAILLQWQMDGADIDRLRHGMCHARNAIYLRKLLLAEIRAMLDRIPEPDKSELFRMLAPDIRRELDK